MKYLLLIGLILVLPAAVSAQAPDGYNFPWQTIGPDHPKMAQQIQMVATALGYPATEPVLFDGGSQSLVWLNIGDDPPDLARDRVLCGLSWVYTRWSASRPACERIG